MKDDLAKENKELKNNSNDKDKTINKYKETISCLEKNIEDIKNEKINIIKDQISSLEDKKRKIEEEIDKLNKTFEKEKYKNEENKNIEKPELRVSREEMATNGQFKDLFENLKNEEGKSFKLEKIIKKTDLQEDKYIFYNLKVIDEQKDIIISNCNEYKIFTLEKNA